MLLKFDGLDTIGELDEDYGGEENYATISDDEMDSESDDDDGVDEETEVGIGYAEKRNRLWLHLKFADRKGEVMWLKHAEVCRPESERNPYGEPGPWRADLE